MHLTWILELGSIFKANPRPWGKKFATGYKIYFGYIEVRKFVTGLIINFRYAADF